MGTGGDLNRSDRGRGAPAKGLDLDSGVSLVDAARRGDVPGVSELLDAGCDIDGYEGSENPLTISAWEGRTDVVRLLLARGAKTDVREGTGRTPAETAMLGNHDDVYKMIKAAEKGRRPSLTDVSPPQRPHPLEVPAPRQTVEAWVEMGAATIAKVGNYPALGKKLTSVFNFETRDMFVITEDLATKAQSSTPARSFDDLPEAALCKAFDEFIRRGGKAEKNYVLYGAEGLDKTRRDAPPKAAPAIHG